MNEQFAGTMHTRLLLLILVLLLAACAAAGAAGDPAHGKQLFDGTVAMAGDRAPACVTCHSIDPGPDTGSGQSLSNIGNRAGTTVPGQPAEEYLRTAITNPDAYLAGGYQNGIMYRDYAQALSPQQINDLVAYMLTLKSGQDQ
jgi:cytochrome c